MTRWSGAIQPSRFLSHTGKVLPGVRRVLPIASPAAGSDWSITVPSGVQWYVIGGRATLTTDATVANRSSTLTVTVDGLSIWALPAISLLPASSSGNCVFQSGGIGLTTSTGAARNVVTLPNGYLPEGAVVGVVTGGLDANDQWSALTLWIEEVYVTDPQLSEIARTRAELDREVAAYEFEQAEQAGGVA